MGNRSKRRRGDEDDSSEDDSLESDDDDDGAPNKKKGSAKSQKTSGGKGKKPSGKADPWLDRDLKAVEDAIVGFGVGVDSRCVRAAFAAIEVRVGAFPNPDTVYYYPCPTSTAVIKRKYSTHITRALFGPITPDCLLRPHYEVHPRSRDSFPDPELFPNRRSCP